MVNSYRMQETIKVTAAKIGITNRDNSSITLVWIYGVKITF